MALFEWKGVVRVVIGEITRAQQFELWEQSQSDDLQSLEPIRQNEHLAAMIAVYATRRVEKHEGDKWLNVNGGGLYELADGETIALGKPELPSDFDAMPRSLANGWISTALEVNGSLLELLSFPSASLVMSSSAGTERKPESA